MQSRSDAQAEADRILLESLDDRKSNAFDFEYAERLASAPIDRTSIVEGIARAELLLKDVQDSLRVATPDEVPAVERIIGERQTRLTNLTVELARIDALRTHSEPVPGSKPAVSSEESILGAPEQRVSHRGLTATPRKRGRPTKFSDEQKTRARGAKAKHGNRAAAQILYKTNTPTDQQIRSVSTILNYRFKSGK